MAARGVSRNRAVRHGQRTAVNEYSAAATVFPVLPIVRRIRIPSGDGHPVQSGRDVLRAIHDRIGVVGPVARDAQIAAEDRFARRPIPFREYRLRSRESAVERNAVDEAEACRARVAGRQFGPRRIDTLRDPDLTDVVGRIGIGIQIHRPGEGVLEVVEGGGPTCPVTGRGNGRVDIEDGALHRRHSGRCLVGPHADDCRLVAVRVLNSRIPRQIERNRFDDIAVAVEVVRVGRKEPVVAGVGRRRIGAEAEVAVVVVGRFVDTRRVRIVPPSVATRRRGL